MHKKFEIDRTKIKGGCQSGRKVVTHDSKSDLPLVKVEVTFPVCNCSQQSNQSTQLYLNSQTGIRITVFRHFMSYTLKIIPSDCKTIHYIIYLASSFLVLKIEPNLDHSFACSTCHCKFTAWGMNCLDSSIWSLWQTFRINSD